MMSSIAHPARTDEIVLADWTQGLKESALQQMLMTASGPEFTSFALGLPAVEFFPKEELRAAALNVLAKDAKALQYSPPSNQLQLQIVTLMAQRGVRCTEEQIFLTSGAQQGMSLLAHLLLNPRGTVVTEELIYTGFQQVIEAFQPRILTVDTNLETGMNVDAVESVLADGVRPAFIYAVTVGHNPLGVSMSRDKRERLVSLSRQYHVPIIEDDAYGFLHYEDCPTPPLRALDDQWVLYVGSFSKILAPALRVGWLVVPPSLISKLSIIKEASDINTATLAQRAVAELLDQFSLAEHLAFLRREYGARRDAVLTILDQHFPEGTTWSIPTSGVFVWVDLPVAVDATALLKEAIAEKLVFIPGQAFYAGAAPYVGNGIRLNFSNCSVPRIEVGLTRLARIAKRLAG